MGTGLLISFVLLLLQQAHFKDCFFFFHLGYFTWYVYKDPPSSLECSCTSCDLNKYERSYFTHICIFVLAAHQIQKKNKIILLTS